MAKFNLITQRPEWVAEKANELDRKYYTIDTATPDDTNSWVRFNMLTNTFALIENDLYGYFNMMPIKESTAQLFQRQELKEEDITTEHMMSSRNMHYARYFYLPAITVKDYKDYRSRQAVAALLSGMASYLLNMFNLNEIQHVYANPTTFQGNHLMRKLGFRPLHNVKKPLASSDVYCLQPDQHFIAKMKALEKRYSHLISSNPWPEQGRVSLLPVTTDNIIHANNIAEACEHSSIPKPNDGMHYLALYREEPIGLVYKKEGAVQYGLHPKWRKRGLGSKLHNAAHQI